MNRSELKLAAPQAALDRTGPWEEVLWHVPLTARASSWTQDPQGVRQQEAEQPRVVQAPNSEGEGPEAAEETLGESQLLEEAEEPSSWAGPNEKSSGQLPSVCPLAGHCSPSGFPESLL